MTSQAVPITILTTATGASRRYVAGHMAERLRWRGIGCRLIQVGSGWTLAELPASILYIFHRVPYDRHIAELVAQAKKRQAVIVFSTDDLTFDPDIIPHLGDQALHLPFRATLYADETARQRRMLAEAAAVIVATPFLVRAVRRMQKPVWLHRTGFSEEMLALSRAARLASSATPRSKIVIGYACGTPSHDRDFAQIEDALQHILQRFPHTELFLIGPLKLGPSWDRYRSRLCRQTYVPWRRLPEVLAQFDINVAPLEVANPVCEAKSELKYVEAALVEVPTVASPIEAFRTAIRSGKNGWLATTPDEWVAALARLIEQPALRLTLGHKAYRHAVTEYHPERRSAELVDSFNQITAQAFAGSTWFEEQGASYPQANASSFQFHYEDEVTAPLAARLMYAARYRGWRIMLMQGWAYLEQRLRYGASRGKG